MSDDFEFPDGPWSERVHFSSLGGGFAFVPGSVIVGPAVTDDDIGRALGDEDDASVADAPVEGFRVARGSFDALRVVAQLRAEGLVAQPEHVLFAHGACPCCCGPHPAVGGAAANPIWPHSVTASPIWPHSVSANPIWPHPIWPHPIWPHRAGATGPTMSTARPAPPPTWYTPPAGTAAPKKTTGAKKAGPRVVVLDSGLATGALLPQMLGGAAAVTATAYSVDVPDENGDRWLDPVAGHGTFIAGVIERVVPGCAVEVRRVLRAQGDADELVIIAALEAIANEPSPPTFLNLSFGGYVWDRAPALTAAVLRVQKRGTVVVASAGNDGTCRESHPAAIPGVVSVGAIGPFGPAPFSNYGPWVRACAPGVDVVSTFFANFDGKEVPSAGVDIDRFQGWARWSGTSFAAPLVVAALVREMRVTGCTNQQAVARLIDAPHLGRIPGLGTVVNA